MRKLLMSLSVMVALAAFLTVQTNCGASLKQREVAAGTTFATCAKVDLTAEVGGGSAGVTVATVIAKVIHIVEAGLANWQTELDSLALVAGSDLMGCIMDMVEAFLSAPPVVAAGSGSGASTAAAVPVNAAALDRVHQYKAKLLAANPVAK